MFLHDSAFSSCPGSGQPSGSLQVTQAMSCGTQITRGKSVTVVLAWVSGLPKGLGEKRFPFSLPSFPFSPETPDTQATVVCVGWKDSLREADRKPRGVLRISSYGDDRRIFWGMKLSISGFFSLRSGVIFFFFASLAREGKKITLLFPWET